MVWNVTVRRSASRSRSSSTNAAATLRLVRRATVAASGAIALLLGSVVVAGPAVASGSGGSGGAMTDRTFQNFSASNGLSSQYHIYAANLSTAAPLCAVFQFHGDGAYEFKNPASSYSLGGSSGIVAKSRDRGCMTVSVLSPDKAGSITWWENGAANALFFRDLMAKVRSDYNIDSQRVWLVGYSGGAQFVTQFYLPLYSSTIDGGGSVVFGGGGVARVSSRPFASGMVSGFHMHWFTGAVDDGSNGTYNALRDAKAGEASYLAKGFATSHEYPANTGHGLSGRFGAVVAQQLALYDRASSSPTPPVKTAPTTPAPTAPAPTTPTNPTAPPAGWAASVAPARIGATLSVNVPAGTPRTTFRVSASPFGTQTGFYLYTTRTGPITLSLQSSLAPNRLYYYQVESGTNRTVMASGTFTTKP
jgi:predicted esterase